MALNHVYKIDKGYEKGVLNKLFQNGKLKNCTIIGDAVGSMSAREYVVKGEPRAKILEFKKATYIKIESEIKHNNLMKVRNIGD
ncbi:hypothetical protein MNBD_GAMMA22-2319 [hydrothermal vent metagenome]|uniref:Uncharacterized protein n=1 Tax=hydrothermal vent metagenome TaxID=652676 RepID=A0A3B0ZF38_9ZZZZ